MGLGDLMKENLIYHLWIQGSATDMHSPGSNFCNFYAVFGKGLTKEYAVTQLPPPSHLGNPGCTNICHIVIGWNLEFLVTDHLSVWK